MGFVLAGCNSDQFTAVQSPSIEQEDLDRLEKITDSDNNDIDGTVYAKQPQTEEEKQILAYNCTETIKKAWGPSWESWGSLVQVKEINEACQNIQNPYALQCVENFATIISVFKKSRIARKDRAEARQLISLNINACAQVSTTVGGSLYSRTL